MDEYYVGVAHGQGTAVSQIYIKSNLLTLEEAQKAAAKYREAHPERDGWNAHVGVYQWDQERREAHWTNGGTP